MPKFNTEYERLVKTISEIQIRRRTMPKFNEIVFVTAPPIPEQQQGGSLIKSIAPKVNPFDSLQKSLDSIAKVGRVELVAQLHKAIDQPGIGAHEVAKREAMRNLADQRARGQ